MYIWKVNIKIYLIETGVIMTQWIGSDYSRALEDAVLEIRFSQMALIG